jgi:uncharacterized protein (TIGR02996 family)
MHGPTDLSRHSGYRDLLAAAAADPLDDGVRLVLSDWLEEHGDLDRAAFVRLQLERARLSAHDPRDVLLSYDEAALLNRHRRAWLAEVPDWLRPYARFERGLPGAAAHLPVPLLLEHAGDDWTCLPLHRLHLKDGAGHLEALFTCPRLSRVTSLHLFEPVGAAALKKLAASRHLGQLRVLGLSCGGIDPAGAKALFAAALPCLEWLDLSGNDIGSAGVAALVRSPALDGLRRLHLARNRLGDAGARHLARWPGLACLSELSLENNEIGDAGARALLESPHRGGIERIDLRRNSITTDLPAPFRR